MLLGGSGVPHSHTTFPNLKDQTGEWWPAQGFLPSQTSGLRCFVELVASHHQAVSPRHAILGSALPQLHLHAGGLLEPRAVSEVGAPVAGCKEVLAGKDPAGRGRTAAPPGSGGSSPLSSPVQEDHLF